jgi:phage host-nuclease inhibitor protein Gam
MGSTATAVRHKGDQEGIQSVEDLDQVIKLIGLCDVRNRQIDNNWQLEKTRLKAEAIAKKEEVKTERRMLLAIAQQYVEAHRTDLLGDRKSRTLNFGKVGYRKGRDKLELPKKGTDEMEELVMEIERLAAIEGSPFSKVAVNVDKYVKKGGLTTLSDSDLDLLGLKNESGSDTFFVEADQEKVKVDESPLEIAAG